MKTFDKQAAQGDVFFRRVESIPANATEQKRCKGPLVVAHSESGGHHQFANAGTRIFTTDDPLVCYLRMESTDTLSHMRPFDTHEAIMFSGGCYEMRRQREYTPEGWRRVED